MATEDPAITCLKQKLEYSNKERDKYWRKASRMEEERDRARRKLKIIQQVLGGHVYELAEEN